MNSQKKSGGDVPALGGAATINAVSNAKLVWMIAASVSGFLLALLVNAFFPQAATGVAFKEYTVFGLTLDMNGAYRVMLAVLIALYAYGGIFAYCKPSGRTKYAKRAAFLFALGVVLAAWDILGTKLLALPQPFFPGPAKILESFLIEGAYIWQNTLYSLRLFAVGFLAGIAFGIGTGILIGWFPKAYYWVYPVLKTTGVIPAVAWMPFALTLFPTPFSAAAFLIIICVWFPVASLTASGISSTPKTYFEAARTLGAKTPYLVFRVAIPHAMPNIFTGISTATAFAFTMLVIAEMMGQPGGLGYYINASKVWSAYYKVFAAIVVMAILFSVIMRALELVRDHVLRWQKGMVKS